MINLITIDNNGTAWIETEDDVMFGIVDAFDILDCDGLKYQESTMSILDKYCDVNQDYDKEANYIEFRFENGESANLYIYADGVELIDTTDGE